MYLHLYLLVFTLITCSSFSEDGNTSGLISKIKKGEDIYMENEIIEEELNFTKIIKATKLNKSTVAHNVGNVLVFKNCTFKKNIVAYNNFGSIIEYSNFANQIVFEDCTFEGEFIFRQANFKDKLNMTGSNFKNVANFESIKVANETSFNKTIFDKEVRFQNAYFQDNFSFQDAQTKDAVNFQSVTFSKDANFNLTKYFGYVEITNAVFKGILVANYCKFYDRFIVTNSFFQNRVELKGSTISKGTMKQNYFYGPFNASELIVENEWLVDENKFYTKPVIDNKYITAGNKVVIQ